MQVKVCVKNNNLQAYNITNLETIHLLFLWLAVKASIHFQQPFDTFHEHSFSDLVHSMNFILFKSKQIKSSTGRREKKNQLPTQSLDYKAIRTPT